MATNRMARSTSCSRMTHFTPATLIPESRNAKKDGQHEDGMVNNYWLPIRVLLAYFLSIRKFNGGTSQVTNFVVYGYVRVQSSVNRNRRFNRNHNHNPINNTDTDLTLFLTINLTQSLHTNHTHNL